MRRGLNFYILSNLFFWFSFVFSHHSNTHTLITPTPVRAHTPRRAAPPTHASVMSAEEPPVYEEEEEEEEVTDEEKMAIVRSFLLQSPPGELLEVANGA